MTDIIDKLRRYYNEDVFQIGRDKNDHYVVSRELDVPNKVSGEPERRVINCIEISIEGAAQDIIIKQILTCSPPNSTEQLGRGKDIIRRIIEFATREMPDARLVVEFDVSKISVHGTSFPLGGLKLLARGETWYNSLGFYEEKYAENTAAIEALMKPAERATFAEIERRLMELAGKPAAELSAEDKDYIRKMDTKVKNKLRTVDNALHLTANDKFSNLIYSSVRPAAAAPQAPVPVPAPSAVPAQTARKTSKKSATKTARGRTKRKRSVTPESARSRSRTRARTQV